VVALRTRTRTVGKIKNFFNFSNFFSSIFQHFYGVLKQKKMIQNRKGRSKAGNDVLKWDKTL
jgi:hypothetical protein